MCKLCPTATASSDEESIDHQVLEDRMGGNQNGAPGHKLGSGEIVCVRVERDQFSDNKSRDRGLEDIETRSYCHAI